MHAKLAASWGPSLHNCASGGCQAVSVVARHAMVGLAIRDVCVLHVAACSQQGPAGQPAAEWVSVDWAGGRPAAEWVSVDWKGSRNNGWQHTPDDTKAEQRLGRGGHAVVAGVLCRSAGSSVALLLCCW